MEREEIYRVFDELLDEMGFDREVKMEWGTLNLSISFQGGRAVMLIKERETQRL